MESRNQWLTDLSKEDIWAKHMESIPSMICFSYNQLKSLAENGQVYGVMLQCKDLYESLYKIPLIMAMIILESNAEYKEKQGYTDVIRLALEQPMSMGRWNELAEKFISKKNKTIILPEVLTKILKKTHELYEMEVSDSCSDVVNWRNNAVGHGALKFEDDPTYQEEIRNLVQHLQEYFDDQKEDSVSRLYESAYFFSGDSRLTGECNYKTEFKGKIQLCVSGTVYQITNFISDDELRLYLFESFYSKQKMIRFSSYIDGRDELKDSKFFTDLFDKFVTKGIQDFEVNTGTITREQEQMLELLNMPAKYIKPTRLIEMLEDKLDETGHGIISMFMERGTGKSAFANQMSGLYHKQPLIKKSFSRCYHVQNATLRGISDFINALNFNFRHSYDHTQDLFGNTDELLSLSLEEEQPDKALAEFLNYYHKQYKKEYTILLIDGIDEITEQTKGMLDFIPSGDMLDEGVFVILLSRFKDEQTVQGSSRQFIEKAEMLANATIEIRRKDDINTEVLRTCIENWKKEKEGRETISTEELIEKADNRFLYLKAYLELPANTLLDKTNETQFISSYLNYVMSYYGPLQISKFQEIAVAIALFPQITLKQYQEYLNCMDLTYEFVGMLNDLMPLLTVIHINGEDAYEFADQAYADYILDTFTDTLNDTLQTFHTSCSRLYNDYFLFTEVTSNTHPEWNKKTKSISFFSEGLLTISNHGKKHHLIAEWFYNSLDIAELYTYLIFDRWAKHGYGHYLFESLYNCIIETMTSCIVNSDHEAEKLWISKFANYVNQQDSKALFMVLKPQLENSPQAKDIYQLILTHADNYNMQNWFWLFDPRYYTSELDQTLEQYAQKNQYIDYIIFDGFSNSDSIRKLLSTGQFTKKQESKLYSALFVRLLQRYSDNYEQGKGLILECLKEMKDKGLTLDQNIIKKMHDCSMQPHASILDNTNIIADLDALIDKAEDGSLHESTFSGQLREAINQLLDFTTSINATKFSEPISLACYNLGMNKEAQRNPLVPELYNAYYKRLCYEKEHNRLSDFLQKTAMEQIIVDFLKYTAKGKNSWFDELLQWIDIIEPLADKDHKRIFSLISRMYIEAIKWLEQQGKAAEAIKYKEKYIYHWDTKAFFIPIIESRGCEHEDDIIYSSEPYVYCTDNAMTLLRDYHTNGMDEQFEHLIQHIENSIRIIDKNMTNNEETGRKCELTKLRFLIFRNEFHISDNFDSYLQSIPELHKNTILNICQNISKNADFYSLNYHIYMLLEYAWQMLNWTEGIRLCDELLNLLSSASQSTDETSRTIIQEQTDEIQEYRDFFEYLSNLNNSDETKDVIVHTVNRKPFLTRYKELQSELYWYLSNIKKSNEENNQQYRYDFSIHFGPYS